MKLDLAELVLRKLDWDDVIPDTLRPIWNSHFEMTTEIHNIKFNRAVIPEDAVDLNVETLEFGDSDASKQIACDLNVKMKLFHVNLCLEDRSLFHHNYHNQEQSCLQLY